MGAERRTPTKLPLPRPGEPPLPNVPVPERFTLANGLRIVAVDRRGLPQVAARLVVPAGSAADPPPSPGTASLTGSLLTEGTERFDGLELNGRIDSLGASLGARVGHDFVEIDLGLLAETIEEGLQLLADVVTAPVFPDREVERIRAETLDALEARLDEPANVADDATAAALFGPAHPYARLPIGTAGGVRAVRREDLVEFHRRHYRPRGSVLVMAGDLGEGLAERISEAFAAWSGETPVVDYPPVPSRATRAGERLAVAWDDRAQSELRMAGPGLPRTSPEWTAAAVANYIVGGSTITGRLGANLREERGWTYGVRSGFASGVHPAGWVVETAVDAAVTEEALSEIVAELARMAAMPVEEEELVRAREALVLSLPRAFETPGRTVARLATLEAFGLEPDYWERFPERVQRVTREDVQRIATRHFAPDLLVRVSVGPTREPGADPPG
jgi:zinc protease